MNSRACGWSRRRRRERNGPCSSAAKQGAHGLPACLERGNARVALLPLREYPRPNGETGVAHTFLKPAEPAIGAVIAHRFEIIAIAGSGGMGTVYRARDRHTGDVVALKLLLARDINADIADRFLREARVLSELCHPGVVAYLA